MARISLKEQYDNQSVIKQIVDLTDQIDGYDEEIEQATQTANDAKTAADAAKTEADAVKTTADNALSVASEAKAVADTAATKNEEQDRQILSVETVNREQDAEIANLKAKDTELAQKDAEQDAAIEAVKETADNSLADVTIQTDAVSASLLLKNNLAAQSSKAVPLASETATGMMTKATYLALADAQDRIAVLEGKTIVVYVTFTSDDPSQEEITNLFEAKAGKAPVAGNQAIDIARSLAYQFSGAEWIKTTQEVGQWTNSTAGIVKGTPAGTENAGTIFAETDGTGSVNGWDDLVARVANNESAIGTTIPSTYATKVALDATDANVANIKTTADNATTKNEEQDTEIGSLKTTVGNHTLEIASVEEANAATDAKAELCYKDAALSDDQTKLVLTRTDGEKTEIVLPSRTAGETLPTLFSTIEASTGSSAAVTDKNITWIESATQLNENFAGRIEDKIYDLYKSADMTTAGETFYQINNNEDILKSFVTQLHESIGLSDGTYTTMICGVGVVVGSAYSYFGKYSTVGTPGVEFVVSGGEITTVTPFSWIDGVRKSSNVLISTQKTLTPTLAIPNKTDFLITKTA